MLILYSSPSILLVYPKWDMGRKNFKYFLHNSVLSTCSKQDTIKIWNKIKTKQHKPLACPPIRPTPCMCAVASVVSNSGTLWTTARQAPLSMGFSRQENWSGLPFLPPGNLPDPGIELRSPVLQANYLLFEPRGTPICIGKGDFYSVY